MIPKKFECSLSNTIAILLSDLNFNSVVSVEKDITSLSGNVTVYSLSDVVLNDFVASALMIDDKNVEIDGQIYFEDPVVVEDLFVENLLNGNDIQNIVSNGLRKNGLTTQNLEKLTVRGAVTFQVNQSRLININDSINQTIRRLTEDS